jgi:hypothetical protein
MVSNIPIFVVFVHLFEPQECYEFSIGPDQVSLIRPKLTHSAGSGVSRAELITLPNSLDSRCLYSLKPSIAAIGQHARNIIPVSTLPQPILHGGWVNRIARTNTARKKRFVYDITTISG